MNWFPLHILIKDLSFMMFYFILMKYNLTNETYLPETISSFPAAPEMTFIEMISASLFYNIIPLVFSLLTYYPIVDLTRKLFSKINLFSIFTTGFFLSLTTPLLYWALNGWKLNNYYSSKADLIAWSLCFLSSMITYVLLNYKIDIRK